MSQKRDMGHPLPWLVMAFPFSRRTESGLWAGFQVWSSGPAKALFLSNLYSQTTTAGAPRIAFETWVLHVATIYFS